MRFAGLRSNTSLGLLTLLMLLVTACDTDSEAAVATAPAPPASAVATSASPAVPLRGKVTVFAAASLTDVMKGIAASFQQANPGVTVEFNFAASSTLATQIEQAAPVDVFASADPATMSRVVDRALIDGTPRTFARNLPVIVTPNDNRARVTAPKDLANAGVKIVLAGPEVPIGNYARRIIDRLSADPAYGSAFRDAVNKNVVSNEANVRAVLAKVELGEADAGIVYRTDAIVSGRKVKPIAIPDSADVVASYPIAVAKAAKHREAATAFVEYVLGAEAQALLRAAGFDPAESSAP